MTTVLQISPLKKSFADFTRARSALDPMQSISSNETEGIAREREEEIRPTAEMEREMLLLPKLHFKSPTVYVHPDAAHESGRGETRTGHRDSNLQSLSPRARNAMHVFSRTQSADEPQHLVSFVVTPWG